MPAFVFVHGLGMSEHVWTDPPMARVIGGLFKFAVMLRGNPEMRTLYHDLMGQGFTVAAWSQSRPVGPAQYALMELAGVVGRVKALKPGGIVLVGHSRGGLVARKYMEENPSEIDGLVTICSPHGASGMAGWAVFLAPLGRLLKPLAPENGRTSVSRALARLAVFLESGAAKELLRGSEFLGGLKRKKPEGKYCISAGGTDPSLVNIPGLFSFPSGLASVLPKGALPPEMQRGLGDGLVSAESSVLPYADEHIDFALNHAEVLVSREARGELSKRLLARFG